MLSLNGRVLPGELANMLLGLSDWTAVATLCSTSKWFRQAAAEWLHKKWAALGVESYKQAVVQRLRDTSGGWQNGKAGLRPEKVWEDSLLHAMCLADLTPQAKAVAIKKLRYMKQSSR